MSRKKHLIIGAGPAALAALTRIRSLAPEDSVTLVTRERDYPFSPTALPFLVAGRTTEAELRARSKECFKALDCNVLLDKEVVSVLPEEKQIQFQDGGRDGYDRLLIATGARPIASHLQALSDHVVFHSAQDYNKLMCDLAGKKEAVIYGGGLVATELAMGLLDAGYRVKVIVRSRLLRSYFDAAISSSIEAELQSRGADILTGLEVAESYQSRRGGKKEFVLSDGSHHEAGVFVACLGVRPEIGFLDGSGITTETGIVVDARLQSNLEGIYAAGDVAETHDFFGRGRQVIPILPNALEQGKIAGSNMVGEQCRYEGAISSNILSFYGNVAFACGEAMSKAQDIEVLESESVDSMRRLVLRDDHLVGAMFLNVNVDPGVVLYLVRKRVPIDVAKNLLLQETEGMTRWLMARHERAMVFHAPDERSDG